jgi:hypothetical protein
MVLSAARLFLLMLVLLTWSVPCLAAPFDLAGYDVRELVQNFRIGQAPLTPIAKYPLSGEPWTDQGEGSIWYPLARDSQAGTIINIRLSAATGIVTGIYVKNPAGNREVGKAWLDYVAAVYGPVSWDDNIEDTTIYVWTDIKSGPGTGLAHISPTACDFSFSLRSL